MHINYDEDARSTGRLLDESKAVMSGHFVGVSGKHLNTYVAKDRGTRLATVASELCRMLALRFADEAIDAVVSPAVGGVALSQWGGYHLTRLARSAGKNVLSLYCEHEQQVVATYGGDYVFPELDGAVKLQPGETLVVIKPSFVLKRGFAADISGRRVVVFEDVLTTGASAAASVSAVQAAGGIVVGVGVLVNGGSVTADKLGAPRLEALLTVDRKVLTEEECAAKGGMCYDNIPVRTDFGHGAHFLAKQFTSLGRLRVESGGQ